MSLKRPGVPIAFAGLVLAAVLAPLLIDLPVMATAGRVPEAAPAPPTPPAEPAPPAPAARVARHAHDHDDDDAETPEPASRRGWLGVRLGSGGRIDEVTEGGAAQSAGIREGDRIVELDGTEIDSTSDIIRAMDGTSPGDSLKVKILRGDEIKFYTVKLGDRPEELGTLHPPMPPKTWWREFEGDKEEGGHHHDGPHVYSYSYGFSGPRLGVSIHPMSEDLRAYFKAPKGQGLLVDAVMDDTPAAKAGIRAGDVIVKVDGQAIEDVGDIGRALSEHEAGDKVPVEVIRDGARETVDVTLQESLMKRPRRGSFFNMPGIKIGPRALVALPEIDTGDIDVDIDVDEISREVDEAVRKAMEEVRRELEGIQEKIRLELKQREDQPEESIDAAIRAQQEALVAQQARMREAQRAQARQHQDLVREQQRLMREHLRQARSRQGSWEL